MFPLLRILHSCQSWILNSHSISQETHTALEATLAIRMLALVVNIWANIANCSGLTPQSAGSEVSPAVFKTVK